MQKEPYFVKAANELQISVQNYLENTKYNYVIIDGIKPVVWGHEPDCPVIYGGMEDVANELTNWPKPIKNISIITEEDYIKTYIGEDVLNEYTKAEEVDDMIMDTTNGHPIELVEKINDAWRKNREAFCPILCALYKRDIGEITDSDSFKEPKWMELAEYKEGVKSDKWDAYHARVLSMIEAEWDFHAYNYLMHIADDCDIEAILHFLHYPYLSIYKD